MNKLTDTILIVEDDPSQLQPLIDAISPKYQVLAASNQAEALAHIENHQCIVAIIDVNLAKDESGIDICKHLREREPCKDFPCGIMFVTECPEESTLLNCYLSGADDFITKPLHMDLFMHRLDVLVRTQQRIWQLRTSEKNLEELVGNGISQISDYGSALNLVKATISSRSTQSLAEQVIEYYARSDLRLAITFYHGDGFETYDTANLTGSELQHQVFELTRHKGRFFRFGQRLMLNCKNVSILFKNPPFDDELKYGNFVDIAALVADAIETRYSYLMNETTLRKTNKFIGNLVVQANDSILRLKETKQELANHLAAELKNSFATLDLTLDQENYFSGLIEQALSTYDEEQTRMAQVIEKLEQVEKLTIDVNSEPVEPEPEVDHQPELF